MWLSVFTHTNPWPPPGAGVALVSAERVVVVAPGLAVGFGLNSGPIFESGLAGDADAAGVPAGGAAFFLRTFFAGEADASGLEPGGGPGLCAPTRETPAKIIIDTSRARFVVMKRRLEAYAAFRQR